MNTLHAQQKHISLSAGMGMAYVSKKNVNVDYSPVPGMNITASLIVPVSEKLFIETGIGYRRKGFRSLTRLVDEYNTNYFHGYAHYDHLSIPLSVSYRVKQVGNSSFWAGLGMNYSFMLNAWSDMRQEVYSTRTGKLTEEYSFTMYPRIGLVQNNSKQIAIFMFDTALQLQLGYIFRDRYRVQLFHEHSLYSFVANSHNAASLKLRYTGISLGIVIPKMQR